MRYGNRVLGRLETRARPELPRVMGQWKVDLLGRGTVLRKLTCGGEKVGSLKCSQGEIIIIKKYYLNLSSKGKNRIKQKIT
jgi:hypothetical protein